MAEKYVKTYEMAEVGSIIPYVNNARMHTDEQIDQIAGSIHEFGFNNPIIIDEDNMILAGHGRKLAAMKLNIDTVPVIRVKGMSEAQKKAFIIAANKIGDNSTFDFNVLSVEIEKLKEMEFDLDKLGFSDFEITTITEGVFGSDDLGGEFDDGDMDFESENGYSIHYTLVFDNEDQQKQWMDHLGELRRQYPEHDTIAGRLMAYIADKGHE